jgi:hypothetical protein
MPEPHDRYNSLQLLHYPQTKGTNKNYIISHEFKQLLLKFTRFESNSLYYKAFSDCP